MRSLVDSLLVVDGNLGVCSFLVASSCHHSLVADKPLKIDRALEIIREQTTSLLVKTS